jgi:hypothetical protein
MLSPRPSVSRYIEWIRKDAGRLKRVSGRGQDGVDGTSMVVDRGRVGTAGSVGIADILGACRLSSTLYFRKEIVCSLILSTTPRSAGV